ncbi:MAG: hypothetical protein P8Q95_04840 [Candidatus Poseidoniaceae archaeon]|nr:hypothetical protein [Candidatus Poseidoniaceae archaeon]
MEGRKLVESLEIPGLKSFVKQEIILGVVPYIVLLILMLQNQYVDITISSLTPVITLFTAIVFLIWFIFDIIKSLMIYRELSKLADDTTRLKKITGSALDGLRFVISAKGIVRRTAMKYTAGMVRGKLEKQQKEKKSFFRKIGISGLKVIENVTSYPERVSKKLASWVKEDLDERLMKRFQKYSNKTKSTIFINLLWSLVPAIWIVLVYYLV